MSDDCEKCCAYLAANPNLIHACASVGIEHAMSARRMLAVYLLGYHSRDHQELPR